MKRTILANAGWLIIALVLGGGYFPPAGPQAASGIPVKSWTRTWGGNLDESAHNIAVDAWGNLYVTGEFAGTVNFDPADPNPNATFSSHDGTPDVFLSKFSADGTFQWAKTWGSSFWTGTKFIRRDVANGIGVDSLGNVYVAGPFQYTVDFNPDPDLSAFRTSNSVSQNNVFLSKFSPDGTFQWVKTWGPSDAGAEGYDLAVDKSNNIYVVGDFSGSSTNFNPWDTLHPDWHINHPPFPGKPLLFDAYLSKFDSGGNFLWAKTWGGEGYDDSPGVAVDDAGNAYVAGMYGSTVINFDPAGGSGGDNHPAHDSGFIEDAFLSKFDTNGAFQWVRTWGAALTDDIAESAAVDGQGNIYVDGRFASLSCDFNPGAAADPHSTHGLLDAFVSKFDPNGNYLWARTWGGSGNDGAGGLTVDGANNVYITGNFVGTAIFNPEGTKTIASNGMDDVFLTEFDANGAFQMAKAWGGSGKDYGYRAIAGGAGSLVVVGSFNGSVNFDPEGGDGRLSNGQFDAFISKFLPLTLPYRVYLPGMAR